MFDVDLEKSIVINANNSVWDGKKSIEHQLDIHINDLTLQSENISIIDILNGIAYVMSYRIKGGRTPHLDEGISNRLVRSLLNTAGLIWKGNNGGGSKKDLKMESKLSLELLLDFVIEIQECREALSLIEINELRHKIRFDKRLLDGTASEDDRLLVVELLSMLTQNYRQFGDWTEFFPPPQRELIKLILERFGFFQRPLLVKQRESKKILLPPVSLYFDRDPSRVFDMFQCNPDRGLTDEQILEYQRYYGTNELPRKRRKPVILIILDQFKDFMIILLLLTMILSLIVDWPHVASTTVLGLVVLFNISVGAWQEWKTDRAILALQRLSLAKVRVLREEERLIDPKELVPGDLVFLAEGDAIPADLRLVKTNHLAVIEASLTGESEPVQKNAKTIRVKSRRLAIPDCQGNAFMGCTVSKGTGQGIVVRTGIHTEIGQINMMILLKDEKQESSPLQKSLSSLGRHLVIIAAILCTFVAVIGIAYGHGIMEMLKISVSLGVSVIPEGLVAVMTLTIAIGISRLAKEKVLVRKPQKIEILGSVTTVCVDKTGTITQGQMRVEKIHSSDDLFCMFLAASCCSNVTLVEGEFVGDSTETALLGEARLRFESLIKCQKILEIPFDSDRRMMTVVFSKDDLIKTCDSDVQINRFIQSYFSLNDFIVMTKGACESVMQKCSSYLDQERITRPLNEQILNQITDMENFLSDQGLRVLCIAFKSIPSEGLKSEEELESGLVHVGLIGLMDPPRQDIFNSINDCHRAQIKVCMITGDHVRTAVSIAKMTGIYNPDDHEKSRVMKGAELDLLSEEAILSLRPFPVIFARVSPQNKLNIVKALKKRHEIVIMTGDGVNDAPAIRYADVGIAMGGTGTQLTKDAADVVLLRDSFSTIVTALRYGRVIHENLVKFMVYLLACNSAELWTVLTATCLDINVPFSATNILWANLIADVPPSLCLGLENDPQELKSIMNEAPKKSLNVLGPQEWSIILIVGMLLAGLTIGCFVRPWRGSEYTLLQKRSEAFFIMTGLQLVLALFSRSTKKSALNVGLFGNRWLFMMVSLSFGLLMAGHYVPVLNDFLDLTPIKGEGWFYFIICTIIMIFGVEILKLILRRRIKEGNS